MRKERIAQALLASALDLVLGDPATPVHPVRWAGVLAGRLEEVLYGKEGSRAAGLTLLASTMAVTLLPTVAALRISRRAGRPLGFLAGTAVIYYTLSCLSLKRYARDIERLLLEGRLEEARERVAEIVGRDTADLDEPGVVRAAIESAAENASDGIVAPLIYAAVGGPLAAAFYRVANTLDSMVGYRSERYAEFGWSAARLDDALNYVPARITAAALIAAGAARGADAKRAIGTTLKDAPKHASPNAGWPEAAMAGLLGVRLGGVNLYGGRAVECPYMGEPLEPLVPAKIQEAVGYISMAHAAVLLALLLAGLVLRRVGR